MNVRIAVSVPLELRCAEAAPLELLVEHWPADEVVQVAARVDGGWLPVELLGGAVRVER